MIKNIIKNKAKNLIFLRNKGFNVPKLTIFKCNDFIKRSDTIINKIQREYKSKVAIRSSAKNEDGSTYSNAGKYTSFELRNLSNDNIFNAIKVVISKFKKICIKCF